MRVRCHLVEQQQEPHAQEEPHGGRHERQPAHALAALQGGQEQAPERGGHHHARGEARERALHALRDLALEQEHHRGTEADVSDLKVELSDDRDDPHYDVDFVFNGMEYSVEVSSLNGTLNGIDIETVND